MQDEHDATPTGTILHRNPEIVSAAAASEWLTLTNSVFTVPSRWAPDGPPPAHRILCRNSGGAAPPGLGSQRLRTFTSRRPRAGHIPGSPENTVVAVPPHSECGHPQPASFSSAPHSHRVHPKPTAAPYTRVETTRHTTARSNRHRDSHPLATTVGRAPTEKPRGLTPISWPRVRSCSSTASPPNEPSASSPRARSRSHQTPRPRRTLRQLPCRRGGPARVVSRPVRPPAPDRTRAPRPPARGTGLNRKRCAPAGAVPTRPGHGRLRKPLV